jgi:peptide/nickel transport system substrate-binding protein
MAWPWTGAPDQYALACVTYQLLTGGLPFARDHGMAVLLAHLSAPPPSLTARRPDLPAAADQMLAKGMAKTPDERFASCGDFADALREALGLAPYNPGTADAMPAHVPPSATPESDAPATQDPTADERDTMTVGPPGGRGRGGPKQLPDAPDEIIPALSAATGRTIAQRRRRLSVLTLACAAVVAAGVIPLVLSSTPHPPKPPVHTGTANTRGSSANSSAGVGHGGSTVAAPKAGGSITVLEGSGYSGAWSTLDPAQNTEGAATQDFMDAIYGQLFELGPGGKVVPDLATGYAFSPDAKTVTITLRQGVTFTDGTPFNAQAVAYNWERDLGTIAIKNGLNPPWLIAEQPTPAASPPGTAEPPAAGAIQVTGPYTIVVHQDAPNGAFINQLFDSITNWIASPTALKNDGASFGQHPVGAGPFEVVSNVANSQLVVKKNPNYWQTGRPYLDQITFKTVGSDEAAYEALLANQGQVYEDMSTTALINESASHFEVENNLGTAPYDLQLNTAVPPFNNPKAREAIYAATDFAPILLQLFGNRYPLTQSFTGPGGICYEPTVPGYQGYDPALARQLVQETGLNKVTIRLGTINLQTANDVMAALKAQWSKVGINAATTNYSLADLIAAFEANGGKQWQALVQTAGAYDPAGGVGVGFRFQSTSPFSGVHDPHLDQLLLEAQGSANVSTRCSYYDQAAEYIAKNYYGPFYFSFSPANISVKGVGGPGLSSPLAAVAVTPAIPWEDVYYTHSGS